MLIYLIVTMSVFWVVLPLLFIRHDKVEKYLVAVSILLVLTVFTTFHLCGFDKEYIIPLNYCYALFLEDKLFESLSAIALFCSSVLVFLSINNIDTRLSRTLKMIGGIGIMLIFLEEISWGQRILIGTRQLV